MVIGRAIFRAVIHSNQKARTTQVPETEEWISKMWHIVLPKIGMRFLYVPQYGLISQTKGKKSDMRKNIMLSSFMNCLVEANS